MNVLKGELWWMRKKVDRFNCRTQNKHMVKESLSSILGITF